MDYRYFIILESIRPGPHIIILHNIKYDKIELRGLAQSRDDIDVAGYRLRVYNVVPIFFSHNC